MKKLQINKNEYYSGNYSAKAKKQSLVTSLILLVLFLFSSFLFFQLMYSFCVFIGGIISGSPDVSINDLIRTTLPFLFVFLECIFTLVGVHRVRRIEDDKRATNIKKYGIVVVTFAMIDILYVIIGTLVGRYKGIAEGFPSALFPLDTILVSLFFLSIGIMSLIYHKYWITKAPYIASRRPSFEGKAIGLRKFGFVIWFLVALYGFASFGYSLAIVDWNNESTFFALSYCFLTFIPSLLLLGWEFYLKERIDSKKDFLVESIISLGISIVAITLYMIAYFMHPQANDLYCFGLMAIDYSASVNASTLFFVGVDLVVPVIALVYSLKLHKDNKNIQLEK